MAENRSGVQAVYGCLWCGTGVRCDIGSLPMCWCGFFMYPTLQSRKCVKEDIE